METRWGVRVRRGGAVLVAAAMVMVLAACSGSAKGNAAGPSPTAPTTIVTPNVDAVSCQQVQRIFLQLAAASGKWNPEKNPFDENVAKAMFPLARELSDEARAASARHLKLVIQRNADALSALTEAIVARSHSQFSKALRQTRNAYASLPQCAKGKGKPKASSSPTPTSPTPSTTPNPPAVFKNAKDPGCQKARAAYGVLGPTTSTWNVGGKPFDPAVAKALRTASTSLDGAARAAHSKSIREAIQGNADAFQQLAAAMAAKSQSGVTQGVITMQATAVKLASTCPLT